MSCYAATVACCATTVACEPVFANSTDTSAGQHGPPEDCQLAIGPVFWEGLRVKHIEDPGTPVYVTMSVSFPTGRKTCWSIALSNESR